jgi:hypothetical protein
MPSLMLKTALYRAQIRIAISKMVLAELKIRAGFSTNASKPPSPSLTGGQRPPLERRTRLLENLKNLTI